MLTGQEQYYWERAGYFVRRAALTPDQVEVCLAATERVVRKCRSGSYSDLRWADTSETSFWGINHLLQPSIDEPALAEVLGNDMILGAIQGALGTEVRYHLATLLVDPEDILHELPWHRDLASDLTMPPGKQMGELARSKDHVQFNLALLEDDYLWVVPGTHLEPLSEEQSHALDADPRGDQPGQVCIRLQAGDAVFYNANLLHRGRSMSRGVNRSIEGSAIDQLANSPMDRSSAPRRTLHYAFFAAHVKYPVVPQPWLAEPSFLETLSPALRPLFAQYVAVLQDPN